MPPRRQVAAETLGAPAPAGLAKGQIPAAREFLFVICRWVPPGYPKVGSVPGPSDRGYSTSEECYRLFRPLQHRGGSVLEREVVVMHEGMHRQGRRQVAIFAHAGWDFCLSASGSPVMGWRTAGYLQVSIDLYLFL